MARPSRLFFSYLLGHLSFYLLARASRPGRARPSSSSRVAPPPVEMWEMEEDSCSSATAAALSPPVGGI